MTGWIRKYWQVAAAILGLALGVSYLTRQITEDPLIKKAESKFERWLDEDLPPEPNGLEIRLQTHGEFQLLFDNTIESDGRLYIKEGEPRVETNEGILDEYGEPSQYVELKTNDGGLLIYAIDAAVPEIKTADDGRQYMELPTFMVDE